MELRKCEFSALGKKIPKMRLILFDSLYFGIFYIKNSGKSKYTHFEIFAFKNWGQKMGLKKFRYPIYVNDDFFRPLNYEQNDV